MKMRKKLAALLAAAMIASVMPTTVFAWSENRVTKVVKVAEDAPLVGNDAPSLRIKLKDAMSTGEAFYVSLDGADWTDDITKNTQESKANLLKLVSYTGGITAADFKVEYHADREAIEFKAEKTIVVDGTVIIRLLTTVEDGDAIVEVDGHDSPVDSGEYVFAKTADDYSVELTVDDADKFAKTGDVAEISFKEPFKNAFVNKYEIKEVTTNTTSDYVFEGEDDTGNPTGRFYKNVPLSFEIQLKDSDFVFELTKDDNGDPASLLKGKKGFAGIKVEIEKTSSDTVLVTLPSKVSDVNKMKGATNGEFVIEGLEIKANRNASYGKVSATARNVQGKILDGSQTFVVAEYSDYATNLKMKKDYEVTTGQEVEVQFTLAEDINQSLANNRRVDFTLPKGVKFKNDSIEVRTVEKKADDTGIGKSWTDDKVFVDDSNDKYDSFEFEFERNDEDAGYEFRTTLLVSNSFDKDEIILTAEGRALTEKHEVVAAKVVRPVEVEVTPMDVKVGLRKQTGGKVVIKENAKEAILRSYTDENGNQIKDSDSEIIIAIDDGNDNTTNGLRITDADVKVIEGDLLLDLDGKVASNGVIRIPVKRQSSKPSTIEVTNIEITADRTVPEGKYDIKVGGAALSKNTRLKEFAKDKAYDEDRIRSYGFMDSVVSKEFINITTKNTEDFTGVTTSEVSFTVGNGQFLLNGNTTTMDAAPYVKDGRTMVPVRYVAQALGVSEEQITWEGGAAQTATIIADKVIQVKLGSKTMLVNGANVPMTAAAEIVEGRVFVPVAEIARALSVGVTWDEATKTATFNAK